MSKSTGNDIHTYLPYFTSVVNNNFTSKANSTTFPETIDIIIEVLDIMPNSPPFILFKKVYWV